MGLKRIIVEWVEGAVRRGAEHPAENMYLEGNFAPVNDEAVCKDLKTIGQLPESLSGAFIRNGPNPHWKPAGGYHWFDGDGMLHSIRLKDGKAVAFANHWVKTNRFRKEQEEGRPVFGKIGDLQGKQALAMAIIMQIKSGILGNASTGNTSLEYHAGRILATEEGNVPWAVRLFCEGALETLGNLNYEGKLQHAMTAHPKVCPNTGNLVFFGYQGDSPIVNFSVANAKGELVRDEKVQFRFPQMVHDFAITDNYAILMDLCLSFDASVMVKEGKLPFVFVKEKGARFGLIKRGEADTESVRWFEASGCYIFHTVNAWEEDGGKRVKLLACRQEEFDLDIGKIARKPGGGMDFSGWKGGASKLFEYTFDLETGATHERLLTELPAGTTGMDFPRIHPALMGKPIKYCYVATLAGPITGGAAKVDVATGKILGHVQFPEGCFGSGDPVFVPRSGAQSGWSAAVLGSKAMQGEEDDGFLLTYVNNENAGNTSELWVMDAKTMSSEPVARVPVPRRIPYGFHGTWVSELDLKQQKTEPPRFVEKKKGGGKVAFILKVALFATSFVVIQKRREQQALRSNSRRA